jgi:hypothetical protein
MGDLDLKDLLVQNLGGFIQEMSDYIGSLDSEALIQQGSI